MLELEVVIAPSLFFIVHMYMYSSPVLALSQFLSCFKVVASLTVLLCIICGTLLHYRAPLYATYSSLVQHILPLYNMFHCTWSLYYVHSPVPLHNMYSEPSLTGQSQQRPPSLMATIFLSRLLANILILPCQRPPL